MTSSSTPSATSKFVQINKDGVAILDIGAAFESMKKIETSPSSSSSSAGGGGFGVGKFSAGIGGGLGDQVQYDYAEFQEQVESHLCRDAGDWKHSTTLNSKSFYSRVRWSETPIQLVPRPGKSVLDRDASYVRGPDTSQPLLIQGPRMSLHYPVANKKSNFTNGNGYWCRASFTVNDADIPKWTAFTNSLAAMFPNVVVDTMKASEMPQLVTDVLNKEKTEIEGHAFCVDMPTIEKTDPVTREPRVVFNARIIGKSFKRGELVDYIPSKCECIPFFTMELHKSKGIILKPQLKQLVVVKFSEARVDVANTECVPVGFDASEFEYDPESEEAAKRTASLAMAAAAKRKREEEEQQQQNGGGGDIGGVDPYFTALAAAVVDQSTLPPATKRQQRTSENGGDDGDEQQQPQPGFLSSVKSEKW